MKKYTVILQSRSGLTHQFHVEELDPWRATEEAEKLYYTRRGKVYGEDDLGINIVATFEGHLTNLTE